MLKKGDLSIARGSQSLVASVEKKVRTNNQAAHSERGIQSWTLQKKMHASLSMYILIILSIGQFHFIYRKMNFWSYNNYSSVSARSALAPN